MLDTVKDMGRPKKDEKTEQIRLPESVVKLLRSIAAQCGEDPGDYAKRRLVPVMKEDQKQKAEETLREYHEDESKDRGETKAKKTKK